MRKGVVSARAEPGFGGALFSRESFGDTAQQPSGQHCSCGVCVEREKRSGVIVQDIDSREKRGIFYTSELQKGDYVLASTDFHWEQQSGVPELLYLADPQSQTVVEQTLFYLYLKLDDLGGIRQRLAQNIEVTDVPAFAPRDR